MKGVLKIIKRGDIVIEVVDSRIPFDSRSKEIERIARKMGKRLIIVLNKADLVPEGFLKEVQEEIEEEGISCVYLSTKSRRGLRKLREIIKKIAKNIKKDKIVICVVGYANTGKSSLINALKGRHTCETSPVPGWTKIPKLVRISRWLYLLDTPGIIPIEKSRAEILGLIRAEKIEDPISVAKKLIKKIAEKFPEEIKRIYKIEPTRDPEQMLMEIAKRMGKFLQGGRLDIESVSRKIITDWYSGKIRAYFRRIGEEN